MAKPSNSDQAYFLTRAGEERRLASEATSAVAQAAHIKLAQEYDAKAQAEEIINKPQNHVYGLSPPDDIQSSFYILEQGPRPLTNKA
ncbi:MULTISPECIES: hypothetical protein [Sphingomonas]|uniref:hypothetical protein n=1 Tax=Sphingomonas TaxID=13687 RepID=UPI00126A010B|nr:MULTISPECIES: hypothetical protein [Sphingomonas]